MSQNWMVLKNCESIVSVKFRGRVDQTDLSDCVVKLGSGP